MKKKQFIALCLTAVLVCSLGVPTVYATPSSADLQDEQDEVEAELKALESQLEDLIDEITELKEDIEDKYEAIAEAGEAYEVAKEQEETQYAAMVLRIKYIYEEGTSDSLLDAFFQSSSIVDFLNRIEYINSIQEYDDNMLSEYVIVKEKAAALQVELEAELEVLEELEIECAEKQEELNDLIEDKEDEIAYLDVKIQEAIEAEEAAAEAARLAAEAAAAAAAAAANSSSSSSSSSGSYSNTSNAENYVGSTSAVVNAAATYLGVPYLWGGTSYSGIDCSGLTQAAYKACGISIPRTSASQRASGYTVGYSVSDAEPGDILCYDGHVAIYAGNGMMIHAPSSGKVVCYVTARTRGLLKVVRFG